ncbi:MAG: FAD-dependent oxidoreductase [bacterium]
MKYGHLFSPITMRGREIRNRIVMTAHLTHYAEGNLLSDRHEAYYRERARGGVGMIIMEAMAVHPTAHQFREIVFGWRPELVERYRRIADGVHEFGGAVLTQLWHSGHHCSGINSRLPVWAPSPLPDVWFREMPKEMDPDEISELVESFGRCAALAREGGLDGVEINGAHSYMVAQFLSPLANKRKDGYGGSLDNRMRFPLEVLGEVRRNLGDDLILGIRLSADELMEGGMGLEDMKKVAVKLEESGLVDFINVSIGVYQNLFIVMPSFSVPPGYQVDSAREIKSVLRKTPVVAVGRIKTARMADELIREGAADMVAMTRATICDPFLPSKATEGREDEIIPCNGCNQACVQRTANQQPITCILNPSVGRERELGAGTVRRASGRKRVVVAGGGVAGCEAALVCALRGHDVTLFEKRDRLGGQVNLIAKTPFRSEFGEVVEYYRTMLGKSGVRVELNSEVDAGGVMAMKPDAVVVATGSVPGKTGFSPFLPHVEYLPGHDLDCVLSVDEVLEERKPWGRRVVIYDEEGAQKAPAVCEFLLERGCGSVEIVTTLPLVSYLLILNLDFWFFYPRLLTKGAVFTPFTVVNEIKPGGVVTTNAVTGERRDVPCDTVVLITGRKPDDGLYHALRGRVETHRAGDCLAPRSIEQAVEEGNRVGRQI